MNDLPSVVKNEFEALGRHMVASGQQFAADTMEVLEKGVPYAVFAIIFALGAKWGYDFLSKKDLGTENTF